MLKAVCTMLPRIPLAAYPVSVESISSFLLSSKINLISSVWIIQLFPMPLFSLMYSKSWSSLITQSLPLFRIMWSRTPSITRHCRVFSIKTALIWSATVLQLAFAWKILCNNYNNEGSRRLELIKTGSRAPIADILCIEAWNRVLISVPSVSVLTISICLVRACFWIFFSTFTASKIMFDITLG